ncbi:alkaline phosphatase family protein [Elizabethkingia argentiflava]|uniref:Alkaline phosphatase family protein n=1 Tax=Elizabethkingia argenteiflava TaxID=2681556 RepID=A0A845PWI3_9FLAO|nr:ectonucleotide pyrophosphatase/phosphodiesterase [Elizabethkingia argenteiflava]NAW51226.1 alkaline phosphatase family protein [Elizabethkingia argenteiflava]
MKHIFFIFYFLLASYICAQKKVDTAQIVVSGRVNAPETFTKPYVILISADGFRYDYMHKYKANNLLKLAENGVWASKGMYPSYPSITFPNHYSIITGLYPSHHGIVDNDFYDPTRQETYTVGSSNVTDGSWYGGAPLWGVAEKQGVLSACLFWVGSESDAGGIRPTYSYQYHEKFSSDDKVKIVKNWLELPDEKRPHFITLYFPEVDKAGHKYGPDAPQTEETVQYIDSAVQKLTEALKPLNLPINFIFLSDHGMIKIDPKDYIPVPDIIDRDKFTVINSNTFVRITARHQEDILPLYKALKKKKHKDYKIYLAENFPRKLHYSRADDPHRRIGDILLVPRGAKALVDPGKKNSLGKHGFSPYRVPEMKATYFSWGPAFQKRQRIKPFVNVDVYPMMAKILGLKIEDSIDGSVRTLNRTLQKK